MTQYNFEYTTLDERIEQLETRVRELENIIDKIAPSKYNLENYSLGDK